MIFEELPEDTHAREFHEAMAEVDTPLDVLFEAPWSVSILWASFMAKKDEASARQVITAHEVAVDFGLQFLHREGAYGRDGLRWLFSPEGLDITRTFHYAGNGNTGDMNLHTHVMVGPTLIVPGARFPLPINMNQIQEISLASGAFYERIIMSQLTKTFRTQPVRDQQGRLQLSGVNEKLRQSFSNTFCSLGIRQSAAVQPL